MGCAVGNWSVELGLAGLLARRQAEAATATKAFSLRENRRAGSQERASSAGRSAPKRAFGNLVAWLCHVFAAGLPA